MEQLFETIYEDGELLVINKPAGLVCHPTKTDEYSSLISRARLHVGPGARPHLVNRLDRETSGITLVAKGLDTARELCRIWEGRQVEKDYLALVEDRLTPQQRRRLILPHHALHAREVRFQWQGRQRVFRAEPEPWFTNWWRGAAG